MAFARFGEPLKLGQQLENEVQCDRATKRDRFGRVSEVIYLGGWWTAVWGLMAQGFVSLIVLVDPASVGPEEGPAEIGWIVGKSGFAAGILFKLLLFVGEPKKRTGDLGWFRAALWGALAGGVTGVIGFNEAHLSNTCALGVVAA